MSETIFYSNKRKANERKGTVQAPIVLVGKAPTKEKRIRYKFIMPLSGAKTGGTPEWILNALEFVSKNHDTVKPDVTFNGFDIQFNAENLFGPKSITATKCKMKSFEIYEMGSSESPDVVMAFFIYAPFATKLHTFLGQMAGEEIWLKFTAVEVEEEQSTDFELTGEEDEEEEGEEDTEDPESPDEEEEL